MIQPVNSPSFKAIYKQPGGRFTDKEFELIDDVQRKMKTTEFKISKNSSLIDFLDVKNYHLFIKPGTFKDTIDISLSKGVSFSPEGIKLQEEKFVGTFSEDKEFLPEYVENTYRREKARNDFNLMGIISTAIIVATIIFGAIATLSKGTRSLNNPESKEVIVDSLKALQKDSLDISKKLIK